MLNQKEVYSVDLVNIFTQRCQKIGLELNMITELTYKEAIKQAQECDEIRKKNPEKCTGILFGIPISIKDIFLQKDYVSYIGLASKINTKPSEIDGFNIYLLKQQGAIPFVRSNVPQCALTIESINHIFGRTLNPWDQSKAAGGSSGGEGALVSSRCSPLGFGSDLSGSIRIPAAFCGVYGFKPTAQRGITNGHCYYTEVFNGLLSLQVSCGPIGKSVEDLTLFFRCFCDKKQHEEAELDYRNQYLIVKEFDEKLYTTKQKLKVGYFKTLSHFDATLANQRAVEITIDKLKELGHEVVEIKIPSQNEIEEVFFKIVFSDGFSTARQMTDGEQFIQEYKALDTITKMNYLIKSILISINRLLGEKRVSNVLQYIQQISAIEQQKQVDKLLKIKQQFITLFKKYNIQAVVCPSLGTPALKHGKNSENFLTSIYTYIWNFVDFPAGIIPVTKVLENEQHYKNSRINDSISKDIDQNMKNTKGMPVGVQVVGLPNMDELVLNLMKQIDEKIGFYKQNEYPL
ncbi:hypothetical protein IMG5_047440 [Ichthyophthirius multifiliis]|uniref:Amidase domain-containing protein n=1 Tax=Ichthyophthirius multifiliis TaxID=5932 RepID=G0QMB3_ICHMU|nr:hypothetical protein IMG5_047440 [Ichthyophthirius multifiliis]EGR33635.1 hypothetical protein IMG5_047440 [Ichthyophthirius multifiliis]|eukprot:XP_004037621.1 hypothetical protein IMG5_047440 [Ichthyophthirius multifiliis]